jgi:hypothetical protein
MKPIRSFLFIFAALLLLLAFPMVCPNKRINFSGVEFRVYNLDFLVKNKPPGQQAKPSAPEFVPKNEKSDLKSEVKEEKKVQMPLKVKVNSQQVVEKKFQVDTRLASFDINVPDETAGEWANLGSKFSQAKLYDKPLRILYYGDSQIENDRITSVFRKMLQEKFGGAGRGLVPLENAYNSANNFAMSVSDNWAAESVKKNKQAQLDLGLMCEAFRMHNSKTNQTSWVKIKSLKDDPENGFTVLSIFYRATSKAELKIKINSDSTTINDLPGCDKICEMRYDLGKTPKELELRFTTSSDLTVYGLNLESPAGIMVDNISLRGLSSPEFSKIDPNRLQQMAQLLNPSFVILQYGVNVVPNITSDYSFYKKILNKELDCLKKTIPGIPILLVSVSDMACRASGTLETYPNIEKVLAAQKQAALENGCAFWNLFESMGGKGSMISWVEQQPPLGNKDYVHYTTLGAEKVGNLFARQFIKSLEPGMATALLVDEH